MSAIECVSCDEAVQPCVKLGVLEVVLGHEDEEAAQREDGVDAAARVAV